MTSSLPQKPYIYSDNNLILHAILTKNGTEIWNKSIIHNNVSYISSPLFVSATNDYIIYGTGNGNNSFSLYTFHLNNGSLVWQTTILGTLYQSQITMTDNPKESRLILIPQPSWRGKYIYVSDLSSGKGIIGIMASSNRNFYLTDKLRSIIYTVGDGSNDNINSNWLLNGSKRELNLDCFSVIGADSNFIVIDCESSYDSTTNIYSLITNKIASSIENGGGGTFDQPRGFIWSQSTGSKYILYKSFKGNTYSINSISVYGNESWSIPADSSNTNLIPIVFLPKQGLVLFTSKLSSGSNLTAVSIKEGNTLWSQIFNWSVILKSGYEANFNVGYCSPSTYSIQNDNKTLILIDTRYNGHAISLQSGIELFNISLDFIPNNINPYAPPNTLSVISNDAEYIYSVIPKNDLLYNKYKNGYIRSSYVGHNCDEYHYGQGCNKKCDCIHPHGKRKCDSGVFGTGFCSGPCNKNWTGYTCDDCIDNNYGKNCSKRMTCQSGISPNYPWYKTGGICDCGINGTGNCDYCYPRFQGENCEDCTEEFYGEYCSKTCSCKYGKNSSGINGTGNCKYCNDEKWSGLDCNLCNGKEDAPQCNKQYKPVDCLDPINGESIRKGCPSMCDSCPTLTPFQKYKCVGNNCIKVLNNTIGGGTLEECKNICGLGNWKCNSGYCIPTLFGGLNRTQCKKICL